MPETTTPPDPQAASAADIEAYLVRLACSYEQDWNNDGTPRGGHCDGTGLRFPALSRECPERLRTGGCLREPCPCCTDGRVAAATLETVMETGDHWEFWRITNEQNEDGWGCTRNRNEPPWGYAATPLEAAIRALAAAVQAEKETA